MKKALLVLAVLVGFSVPLQAQTALPVEVICTKGAGTYKPICGHVKQAVKKSPLFKKAKRGNRYVVSLFAETGEIGGGDIDMSITYAAAISDPLSQVFPYHIASIPFVFSPSESRALGVGIVDGGLLIAVLIFSAVVDEINSYGILERQLSEATVDDIQKEMKLEMERILEEQTN